MIISNILQALSGTVNNIYLGQMLGVKAMAAVSALAGSGPSARFRYPCLATSKLCR